MAIHTFARANGEKIYVEIEVNETKLAEHLARTMAVQGKTKKTIAGGSVTATVLAL